MYDVEHDIQPDKFPNIFATFWWPIATLTTIGYGDVYPISGVGQFIAGMTAIFGIGFVAIPTSILSSGFIEALEEKRSLVANKGLDKFNFCPHCGKRLME